MSTFNDLKAAVSLFSTLIESQYQIKPGGNLSDEISKNALHIDDNSFCYHWYNFNRGIINAIKLDQKEKLADKLFKFMGEKQFPPDIVKSYRLWAAINSFKPSHIIELGCGTSSLVINEYIQRSNENCIAYTFDNDYQWIKTTEDKINNINKSMPFKEAHRFIHSDVSKSTIKEFTNIVSQSNRCFIFLDAEVIDGDKNQGMDLILKASTNLPNDCLIMIDSRRKSVDALQSLSDFTGRSIELLTSHHILTIPNKQDLPKKYHEQCKLWAFSITQFVTMQMQSLAILK
tara:strand:- start:810 stop:1673 length:864 start_codon:yes stop_codon:yes gene_type:complete